MKIHAKALTGFKAWVNVKPNQIGSGFYKSIIYKLKNGRSLKTSSIHPIQLLSGRINEHITYVGKHFNQKQPGAEDKCHSAKEKIT